MILILLKFVVGGGRVEKARFNTWNDKLEHSSYTKLMCPHQLLQLCQTDHLTRADSLYWRLNR